MMSTNDENTLGSTLELYSRYMEAARVRKHVFTLPLILRTQGKGGTRRRFTTIKFSYCYATYLQ